MAARGSLANDGGPLRVRVLGGFAVEGVEERALGTRKARLLLKRLAVAGGRPVSAEELADAVWGEDLPKNPGDQVSVLVSRLRTVLGAERLIRRDAGYCLRADWFDLVELERSVVEVEQRLGSGEPAAAIAAAHVVLALASGSLLPEEDREWVEEPRSAADRLVARARLAAAEAVLDAGEFGPARAAAQSVLDQDPYDERALRLVMRADALAGRPGAALAAYAVVRHRLSDDLGAEPAKETESLHTAIVRGELPSASTTRVASTRLVGRSRELALMDAALARAAAGAQVALLVEAEAGLGKSTLLSAWVSKAAPTALVLSGRCDELGGGLPLQPLVDALDAYLESLGREASDEVLGFEAGVLEPVLSRGSIRAATSVTTVEDVDAGRAALFGALATVLRRAAGSRPLVIVIDDIHLAAAGTAEFLAFALRRLTRLMVVATRRPEPGPYMPAAERITLSPLGAGDVIALVGAERGPGLYERSGGHPLLMRALAEAPDEDLPASIIEAVRSQLRNLADGAVSIEVAASCGTEVDAGLVSAITQRPMSRVLDDLEAATRLGLLRPLGRSLAFRHELVREAIETGTSPLRKREIHRAAVDELSGRSEVDPLSVARHARLGGDPALAASALGQAADRARQRFEPAAAEALLDEALELFDSASARLSRGRLRVGRLDLNGANDDALRAIELGAGVEGFELAGWIAYYGRDFEAAMRYADEGAERADSGDVQASCLALAGRIRHTRGDLADAASRLEEALAVASGGTRGMVQVWYGQNLAHRGEPEKAADLARRGLLDPHVTHPFVAGHGYFTLAYSLAILGQWGAALDTVDDLDAWVVRQGDRRFPPIAANIRGWLLRGAGLYEDAVQLHLPAIDGVPGPTFQEAHYAALFDLAECHLSLGDVDRAAADIDRASGVMHWTGSMSWRQRNRYRLLTARVQSHSEGAREVADEAVERGDHRYRHRALLTAATIDARTGRDPDPEALFEMVHRYTPLSGADGWRDLAELANATRLDELWRLAETQAGSILSQTRGRKGVDSERASRSVRSQLEALKP